MITKKYYKLIRVSHADSEYFRITNISNEIGEFKLNGGTGTMEYSLDGVNWTSYNMSTKPAVEVNPNSNIYLRGTGFTFSSTSISCIDFNKNYTVGGNFMSLSNYATMSSVTTIGNNNIITSAFNGQTHLISAQNLNFGNVTSVNGTGMGGMFQYCSALTTAPDLSGVTSVGDYGMGNMFYGCSNISTVTAPNINPWDTSKTGNWLTGAGSSATGTKTVYCPTGVEIPTSNNSGIPSGWTRVDY